MPAVDSSTILQHLAVPVIVLDKDLKIQRVNRAAETLLGSNAHECHGDDFEAWVDPAYRLRCSDLLSRTSRLSLANPTHHLNARLPLCKPHPPANDKGSESSASSARRGAAVWVECTCSVGIAGPAVSDNAALDFSRQTWFILSLVPCEREESSATLAASQRQGDGATTAATFGASAPESVALATELMYGLPEPTCIISSDGQTFLTNRAMDDALWFLLEGSVEDEHLGPYITNGVLRYKMCNKLVDSSVVLSWLRMYDENFENFCRQSDWPFFKVASIDVSYKSVLMGVEGRNGRRIVWDLQGGALRRDRGRGEQVAGFVIVRDRTVKSEEIRIPQAKPSRRNREPSTPTHPSASNSRAPSPSVRPTEEVPSLKKYEDICQVLPEVAALSDPMGKNFWHNRVWYEITGATEQEMLESGWEAFSHPSDLPRVAVGLQSALRDHAAWQAAMRVKNRHGQWVWMLFRAHPIISAEGQMQGWFYLGSDFNSAYQQVAANEESRIYLLDAVRAAGITLWSADLEGRFIMAEGELDEHFRDSSEADEKDSSVIGRVIFEEWGEAVRPLYQRALAGESVVHEITLREHTYRVQFTPRKAKDTSSGSFHTDDVASRQDAPIIGVAGLNIDITERLAMESQMAQSARDVAKAEASSASAEAASKMKSQFLAVVSHEIRTPINGVVGLSELLLDVPSLPAEANEIVQSMLRSSSALLTVVNDVLDYSKVEAGKLDLAETIFSPRLVCDDAIRDFTKLSQSKGLVLEHDVRLGAECAIGDASRITQILNNLLSNANKFTAEGHVRLEAYQEALDANTVSYTFAISDTGCGISETQQALLFQPFQQADPSTSRRYGGTGLGLAICKNLVELMGGKVDLRSVVDEGTVVTFSVPLQRSAEVAVPSMLPSESTTRRAARPPQKSNRTLEAERSSTPLEPRARILLAEDNAINSHIAIKNLEKLGFAVKHVENGQEVLDVLTEDVNFDAVLMDCMMPVMDGYEATRIMRRADSPSHMQNIPVVALTAAAIEGRTTCLAAGMTDFISKPVRRATLDQVLTRWLDLQTPHTDPASGAGDDARYLRAEPPVSGRLGRRRSSTGDCHSPRSMSVST